MKMIRDIGLQPSRVAIIFGSHPCLERHPKNWLRKFVTIGGNLTGFFMDTTYFVINDTGYNNPEMARMPKCQSGTLICKNLLYNTFKNRIGGPTYAYDCYASEEMWQNPFSSDVNILKGTFSNMHFMVAFAKTFVTHGIYFAGVIQNQSGALNSDGTGRPSVFNIGDTLPQNIQDTKEKGYSKEFYDSIHINVLSFHKAQFDCLRNNGIEVASLDPECVLDIPKVDYVHVEEVSRG